MFAEAFEVKSHEIDKPAIAECFSNMFGIGTRFATGVLEGGKMVETINIYGIVVSMLHPSIGRLLLITINLHTGETVCKLVTQDIDLPLLFNLVLTKLKN